MKTSPPMKTSHLAVISSAVIAMCTLVYQNSPAADSTIPSIPVGSLTAFPTIVQTGTKPTLTWNISYPTVVTEVVMIDPDGTITPKENLIMDMPKSTRARPNWE